MREEQTEILVIRKRKESVQEIMTDRGRGRKKEKKEKRRDRDR